MVDSILSSANNKLAGLSVAVSQVRSLTSE
jgi:hypothetical protein